MPRMLAVHPGTRLILVGPELEPDYAETLRGTIARLGIADRIFLVGEQRDPHPWFAAADILVFASKLEGFGTVVPEGMAHGLPVVARRLPGVNDSFVLEGRTGFLFDDAEGYAANVLRLLGDPALRRRIGKDARAFARETFAMRSVAARWLAVYGLSAYVLPGAATDLPETGLVCSASVLDRRFHTPVGILAATAPLLLTTVDAEESFDWSRPFSRDASDVRAMARQHLAHRVFDQHGVVPTYLVDYPVAWQPDGYRPLLELLADGRCGIGAQLHPWVNPPFLEDVGSHNSYSGNVPAALEYEKARRLTEVIEQHLGVRPRIFRAGRYGSGRRTADLLKRLDYAVDSCGGVLAARQHRLGRRAVAGLPSPGLARPRADAYGNPRLRRARRTTGRAARRCAGAACLRRVGRAGARRRPIAPRPSRAHPAEPGGDNDRGGQAPSPPHGGQWAPGLVVTYHSPSLEPGNTPYTRSEEDVRRLLDWLDEFYTFFREEIGGRMARWEDVRFGPRSAA